MLSKLLPLIAVAFPGGYKFLVVLIVTTFAGEVVANEFSKIFFWVGLLVTFSGLPIAALLVSKKYVIPASYKATLIILSLNVSFSIAYFIELSGYGNSINLAIFVSVILLSTYEVYKRDFLNNGDFLGIIIASVITLIIFFVAYLFFADTPSLILVLSMFSLLAPMMFLSFMRDNTEVLQSSKFSLIATDFLKYLFSNLTSTSLMAILPIAIISELGDSIAADMAQVFYLSSLSYLLPRALSAKHIPNMRDKGISKIEVKRFFMSIFIFVVIAIISASFFFYSYYQEWLIYLLLFSAMQLSQLSLPLSNILSVKGDASGLLQINMLSTFILLCVVGGVFTLFDKGEARCVLLLIAFCGFQLLKLFLGVIKTKQYV